MKHSVFSYARFCRWNAFVLASLGVLLRFYRPEAALIAWPVSPLISVYLLSLCFFLLYFRLKSTLALFVFLMIFTLSHWILSGLLEIVLTRFFRQEEHYSFLDFSRYLADHDTYLLDGFLGGLGYLFLFHRIQLTQKNEHLDLENKTLQKRLTSTELNLLSREINPHFLFNAMNGIAMKIRLGEYKLAVNMLASLNDLLRLSLVKGNDELIPLREELELLNKYITIERVRFGDNFSLLQKVPEEVQSLKVPRLILQPLVENAFKHGMHNNLEKMTLKIEAEAREKELVLTVYNSQDHPQKMNYVSGNVGIPNVAHRLRNFFGTQFQFQSVRGKEGIAFKVTFPASR